MPPPDPATFDQVSLLFILKTLDDIPWLRIKATRPCVICPCLPLLLLSLSFALVLVWPNHNEALSILLKFNMNLSLYLTISSPRSLLLGMETGAKLIFTNSNINHLKGTILTSRKWQLSSLYPINLC